MVQNGSLGNPAVQPNNMYDPMAPEPYFMNPPEQPYGYSYNPNNSYYAAQQLNMTQPYYGQPQLNSVPQFSWQKSQLNTYFQPQQPSQPWNLMQTPVEYQQPQQPSGPVNPFVQNSPSYYGQNYYGQQQQPTTFVQKGFNPTGVTEMYSEDMRNRLKELNDKYSKLNAQKAYQRRSAYSNFGYNYYGGINVGYRDPVLMSEFNREKAKIEAEARENVNNFNMRISRAAHYYLGDIDVDNDEEFQKVKDVYKDKVISFPQTYVNEYANVRRLEGTIDITEACRRGINEADRQVSEYYHRIVKADASLDDFLQNAGLILWESSVEEMNKKGRIFNERYTFNKLQEELNRNLNIRDGIDPSVSDMDPSEPFRAMEEMGLLRETPGINMDFNSGTITLDRDEWKRHRDRVNVLSNKEQADYEAQRRMFIESVYNSQ